MAATYRFPKPLADCQRTAAQGFFTGRLIVRRLLHRLRDPFTSFAATGFLLCVALLALELAAPVLLRALHGGAR